MLQTHGTIIYEAHERQKPRKYVFGERKIFDFEKPVDKHYSYGQQVDKPSDSNTDHESQNIMMIKNMIEKQMSDIHRVDEYDDTTILITQSSTSTTSPTVDNLQTPSVETVDTIEISSSEDPEVEGEGWSMIGVFFLVAILSVILALLISLFTFVVKNNLFYCFSRDEGKKQICDSDKM